MAVTLMKWHRIWNAQIIATNIQKETGPNPKRDRTNGGGYVGEGGKGEKGCGVFS